MRALLRFAGVGGSLWVLLTSLNLCHVLGRSNEAVAEPRDARSECARDPANEDSLVCDYGLTGNRSLALDLERIDHELVTSMSVSCAPEGEAGDGGASVNLEQFRRLPRLRSLRIIGCSGVRWPSQALAGLQDLRNLSVRLLPDAGTGATRGLELEAGTFDATPQMENVDLSSNNLWLIPERLFCPLGTLVSLNLSRNVLKDVTELGFAEHAEEESTRGARTAGPLAPQTCSSSLQVLDASNNRIVVLPDGGFAPFKRLRVLNLLGNAISVVDDRALRGLRSLEVFDVSDNRIVALPASAFRECTKSLKDLRLRNNSIGVLAPGLLSDLNQLVSLDLSRNALTGSWLDSATFAGLIRLVLLDLSYNRIERLDPSLFQDLYTLQILNLRHNEIATIPVDALSPMSNLHTLELASNRLVHLDAYSLNGLFALSHLALDSNLLETIHPDAFRNCSGLEDLDLSRNNLKTVPVALHDTRMLRTLDLGENRIESLEEPGFKGMSSLYGLRLIGNEIGNVTRYALAELPALQILNLAKNKIERVEEAAFADNPALQAIRLDANLLRDVSDVFRRSPGLLWLNLSDNAIELFRYDFFPDTLQWMDLHGNAIESLGNAQPRSRLRTLDVSFNKITKIHSKSLPNSIELFLINDNAVEVVEPHTFFGKENLTRVDLYTNRISKMDLSALLLAQVPDDKSLPEFYIGGNPFICDCSMEWLQGVNSLPLRQHPVVMDLGSVYCRLPHDRHISYVPLLKAKSSQFLCDYKIHCFALCHCCDFDACDCKMTCPTNCTCYHDQSWSANVVDCSHASYDRLPSGLPMDATEVFLDGNDFGELTSHAFIGRKNLEVLFANNSNVVAIRNHTFSGLRRLRVLHLENNAMVALSGVELAPLENLRELYLQNNLLRYLDNDTFAALRYLQVLRLEGNRLETFAMWRLGENPLLEVVTLSENPWSCECSFMERARQWISGNLPVVLDWHLLVCTTGIPVVLPENATSSQPTCTALAGVTSIVEIRSLEAHLPIILTGLFVLVATIGLLCGLVRHRRLLRDWISGRCALRSARYKTAAAFEDREKPFDAYISYSAIDETFVSRVLVPGLENSYRLCLHYRDLGVRVNVADAVAEAADSSRRTILVLSRNFLHGEWARCEFKMALRGALREKGRSAILLLVGGVCPRDLDADLRKKISSHTVLVWGDKLFWQKLRFAMPDVLPIPVLERPLPLPPPPPPPTLTPPRIEH
ncbi:toll-like receptor 6 [Orussus abietinus]|uniref:toll-like receptor 6 n=1 Tax=Orussus abietinus TaxID=222816 RepID=UPI0006263966|nr:toll-like receptor 6 [Orussus abietinus]